MSGSDEWMEGEQYRKLQEKLQNAKLLGVKRPMACPDCSGRTDGNLRLVHDEGCPVGAGIDEQMEEDRLWFEAHPGVEVYRRPPGWAEVAEMRMANDIPMELEGEAQGNVVVTYIGPGVRTREFGEIWFAVDPGHGVGDVTASEWYRSNRKRPSSLNDEDERRLFIAADAALDTNSYVEVLLTSGTPLMVVSEAKIRELGRMEEAEEAWKLERGDGEVVYIWRNPRLRKDGEDEHGGGKSHRL